jgi:hypothetical protein
VCGRLLPDVWSGVWSGLVSGLVWSKLKLDDGVTDAIACRVLCCAVLSSAVLWRCCDVVVRRGYYAAVSSMDYNAGLILDELSALQLDQKTLVVFLGTSQSPSARSQMRPSAASQPAS